MSLFDDFRALTGELFDAFELPVATITRTVDAPQTNADRAAGRKGASTTTTLTGRGVLGNRNLKLENGSIVQQSIARLSVRAVKGDKLTIGGATGLEVIEVEEVAPDGGSPLIVIAVLK